MKKQENLGNKEREMDALSYECLIRRVNQCGRYGVEGADADIYRRLERSIRAYGLQKEAIEKRQVPISTKSLEELEHESLVEIRRVSAHVHSALSKGIKDFEHKLSGVQHEELENLQIKLSSPTFEKINEVIEKAEKIFVEIEVFPK